MIDIIKLKKGVKRIGAASIDPICKLISAFGILMIVFELCFVIVSRLNFGLGAVMAFGYFFGFFLQGLLLVFVHRVKERDDSWEGTVKYFNFPVAFPALMTSLTLAFALNGFFYNYYLSLLRQGVISSLDTYSLQPALASFMFFIAAVTGIVIQFYPYNRILSIKNVLVHSAISFMCFLISGGSAAIGISFAVYAACAVIILNQSYIIRAYKSVVVTKITASARLYNMRMILLCLLLTAVGGFFALVAVRGIYLLLKFILFLALYTVLGKDQPGSMRLEDVQLQVDQTVFGNQTTSGVFMIMGAVLIIMLVTALYLFSRFGILKSFLTMLKRWFDNFIALFMGSREPENESVINYRDTVEKIERVEKSRAAWTVEESRLTLRGFNSELASFKTVEEKLGYSYLVMIRLLSLINTSLRSSDTPRELEEKISATMTLGAIGEITDLIERIKYAEKVSNPETSKRVLAEVCAVIEKRLENIQ